jgi:hypothetical protein
MFNSIKCRHLNREYILDNITTLSKFLGLKMLRVVLQENGLCFRRAMLNNQDWKYYVCPFLFDVSEKKYMFLCVDVAKH